MRQRGSVLIVVLGLLAVLAIIGIAILQAVIRTGSEDPSNPDGSGNQAFRHSIYHLTIDTGTGNPGAIGLDYLASNRGAVEDVIIRSGDGEGFCGLSMMRQWPGPALIKRVSILGFQSGIMIQHYEYSMKTEKNTTAIKTDVGYTEVQDALV